MANRIRLIQLEPVQDINADKLRFVPRTGFTGEVDHKGEPLQVGELGYVESPYTEFAGEWLPGSNYQKHALVTDGCWTMIANKPTNDRPAPQPRGDGLWTLQDTPTWATNAQAAVVYSGHTYTFNETGWVQAVRAWIPNLSGSTNYRFIFVDITDPNFPIYRVIEEPVLNENAWTIISLQPVLVTVGTTWLIYIDALDDGGSTLVTGGWTYGGSSNANPAAQSWNNASNQATLRIDKTDLDSTDRSTELLGVIAGSTIQAADTLTPTNNALYEVIGAPLDGGSSVNYPVALISTSGGGPTTGQATTLTIEIPTPQLTQYVQLAGAFAVDPSFASITGFLQFDGVDQPGVGDDAFGVDVFFQPATVSPDWDYVSNSCSQGAASSALRNLIAQRGQLPEDNVITTDVDYQLPAIDNIGDTIAVYNPPGAGAIMVTAQPGGTVNGNPSTTIVNGGMKLFVATSGTNWGATA